jgi:nitrile hydratase subunit beta
MSYQTRADLGGQPGHGAVQPEPEGELWHEAFEPRALALTLAMGATGSWNIDQSRAARETQPDYARLSYYRLWLAALQQLMAERGQLLPDEVAAGQLLHPPVAVTRVLAAADVPAALARGSATERTATAAARFRPGDRVRTHDQIPDHHTRLPAYARGKCGVVERVHGTHVFADANAQGLGEQPQWLYSVVFDGPTLWGADAQHGLCVAIDAWEPYLDADSPADPTTGDRP